MRIVHSLLLTAPLILSGCGNMSGLSGSSDFGCKAPAGVSCQSISGVQANAAQGNLPFQREDPSKTYGAGDQRSDAQKDSSAKTAPKYGDETTDSVKVSPRDMVAAHTGMPVRQPPLVLRVWMAPYEDDDKDLHDQSYFYTVVHSGRWMIEANQTSLSNQFRPIHPLSRPAKANSEPVEKAQQPLAPKSNQQNVPFQDVDYPNTADKPDVQGQ